MFGWLWQPITVAELRWHFAVQTPLDLLSAPPSRPPKLFLVIIQGEERRAVQARWGQFTTADQPKSLSTFNSRLETVRGSPCSVKASGVAGTRARWCARACGTNWPGHSVARC